jgi:hypothetical protein
MPIVTDDDGCDGGRKKMCEQNTRNTQNGQFLN